jgi:peptide/nickel transport system substrate-binding protein
MPTRRTFLQLACGLTGVLAETLRKGRDAHAQVPQNTLVWGTASNVSRLNPQLSTNWPDIHIYENVYDALTRRDQDNKLVPGLATEWKLLNDTTWQFKLRPGVKFHDGTPLTAADVKFTIERSYDPAARTLIGGLFTTVQRIDVVDDLTVNFVTKKPDPLLPARHAVWGNGSIMPAKYFQQVGPDGFERKPVGTGPYRVTEWVKDDHLTLVANSSYWGGAPNATTIIMKPKTDPAARVAALLAGEVNLIESVPNDQVERLKNTPNVKVVSTPYAGLVVLGLNPKRPPLDNKLLKQAMSLAVDRQAIVKELLSGQGVVATGSIPQGDFAYNPSRPPLPFSPEKAKELVRQSGYKGEEVTCEVLQVDLPLVEAVVAMWKAVGVNAKISVIENAVRAQKMREKSWQILLASPGSPLGDPDSIIWRVLGPGAIWDIWRDPEFDRLGEEARYSLDPEKRRQSYERMQDLIVEHTPWIPLYQPIQAYGLHKTIQWKPSATGSANLRRDNLGFMP